MKFRNLDVLAPENVPIFHITIYRHCTDTYLLIAWIEIRSIFVNIQMILNKIKKVHTETKDKIDI